MKFEVYCDESYPDLLSSEKPKVQNMVIGSLWFEVQDMQNRDRYKQEIHAIRNKYRIGSEIKWQKVSPSGLNYYLELIDWFFHQGDQLRFRCIVIDREKVDLIRYHESDQELGFYKFYYQLLHHWILDFNEYAVFCDFKSNRRSDRLRVLKKCLSRSNLSSTISNVQAIPSKESVLIQMADLLTGAAAARLNNVLAPDSAKSRVVEQLEHLLGRPIKHTWRSEQKFNVFVIDLDGGW